MLSINPPNKVKFICGFIYGKLSVYQKVKMIMERRFGPIDYESPSVPFNLTTYYNKEMGTPLYRKFIAFKKLKNSEKLTRIKLVCIRLEKSFSIGEKRQINIDPGYITLAKLILLTTKNFYHRIHLAKGIYAEITLRYRKEGFCDFDWTYPDYKTKRYKQFFLRIREIYQKQLHSIKQR